MVKLLNLLRIDWPDLQSRILAVTYSRFLLMTFDAAITSSVRPKKRFTDHIRLVLSKKSSNFDKVPSIINLVEEIIPGVPRYLSSLLCNSNRLPFESGPAKLIDYGSGATVFILECKDECKILKVFRKSLGQQLDSLLEAADWYKERYETVCSWYYNEEFNLVPSSIFLILNGPILGAPAAAALQAYVPGEKKDLFLDFSNDELIDLMRDNDDLRRQFIFFLKKTITIYHSEDGVCLDILGTNNVALVNNGNLRLVIFDIGIFDLAALKRESPGLSSRLEKRISRIEFLFQEVSL